MTVGRLKGVTPKRVSWVLLAYRLPREPSTPRSALWRKLRRLGAAQLLDGLAALPLDARNREQLEWLADEIVEAGGEATIWVGELGSAAQERELAARMAEAIAVEYRALIEQAAVARGQALGRRRRTSRSDEVGDPTPLPHRPCRLRLADPPLPRPRRRVRVRRRRRRGAGGC